MAVESLRLTFPQARQPQSDWIRFSFTGFTRKTHRHPAEKGKRHNLSQNVPQAAVRSKNARSNSRWVGERIAHVCRLQSVSERFCFCRTSSSFCFAALLAAHDSISLTWFWWRASPSSGPSQKPCWTDTAHSIKGFTWPPFSDVYFSS